MSVITLIQIKGKSLMLLGIIIAHPPSGETFAPVVVEQDNVVSGKNQILHNIYIFIY